MNVVIIEDENLSAEHLALLLKKADASINILKYIDTVKSAVSAFKEGLDADLIFMDIHLADGNSFEIFNQVNIDKPIIFTTAYDKYAIQAFKQNSVEYLLKPITLEDVKFALNKLEKQQQMVKQQFFEQIANTYQQINKQYKKRFLVKAGESIDTIATEDIHHFETKESLTVLLSNKGKRYVIDYTLDELENLLQPSDFFRINRKVILHIRAIQKIQPYFNSRLSVISDKLEGDARIVSRERVIDFKKWLDS